MLLKTIRNAFSTLVIAQHNGKNLTGNSLKLLSAAKKLNQKSHVLIFGETCSDVAESIKQNVPAQNVEKIITVNTKKPMSDSAAQIISNLHSKYNYKNVVALSTSFGKDIIPRIAGKYISQPITDVIEVLDTKTFVRPTYAGNALSKVSSAQDVNFITFRASSFEQLPKGTNSAEIQTAQYKQGGISFIKEEKSDSGKPDLSSARIVVSGGRAVKSKQNFKLIYDLADSFGDAAVGASRAAVDSGYCPNQMQVGQTGKVVAPELYIACGISGAVQHLAGMKDSKCIVAINTRPDEPIFEIADYGLEADLFKAVPELTEKIKKIRAA